MQKGRDPDHMAAARSLAVPAGFKPQDLPMGMQIAASINGELAACSSGPCLMIWRSGCDKGSGCRRCFGLRFSR